MLSEVELTLWYERLRLSAATRRLIGDIRSSEPARRVKAGRSNVCGRYPSRKMGVTIQFESHCVELAAIYQMEHEADVLEYYDQPPPLKLNYASASGRRLGVIHTPDFFVIRMTTAGWEEWKSEDDLVRLAEHNSNRYRRHEQGRWCCPPGEAQASPLGLYYHVRSSRQIDWTYQRNIQFLEDYLRVESLTVDHRVRETVLALVPARSGITLSELFQATRGVASRDDVYLLIAAGAIQVDLSSAPLVDPERICLFADNNRAAECPKLPERLVDTAAEVSSSTEPRQDRSLDMGPDQMAEANRRLQIIRTYQAGQPLADGVSERTVRSWMEKFRRAEALQGSGYLGLLPRVHERGNRTPKLSAQTRTLMTQFIGTQYETPKQKPRLHVYGALVRACESQGTPPPSYRTFCEEVKRRPSYELTLKRRGRRAAYNLEPPYMQLEFTTPRHGDRPFHICHIDHTELDVELLCSNTGRNLGRPWLTLLTDAFSRRLLAVMLSFDPPSYRSCMMVLRECVHRHGRLPQIVVVDGGKEFESLYFETLLARYECTKKTRPPAKARFGSVCERVLGTTHTQFVYNLAGNTQITKEVRAVTAYVDPKNHAVWTLARLYDRLCGWAYELYDTTIHPALRQTPRDCFADGMARTGLRKHRSIPYDEEFRMMTLPTTTKATALVSPGKGVKINCLHYWSSVFRDPTVENTRVPVRYDPYDAAVAYACVGSRWVSCCSEHYAVFRGRSEREMMLAAAELRRQWRDHSRNLQLTARRLADFMASVEAEESLLVQRLRDAEAKHVYRSADGRQTQPEGDALPPDVARPTSFNEEMAPRAPELFEEY